MILYSAIDLKKYMMELTYARADFLFLIVLQGLSVDMASFLYQLVRVEALKINAQILLPYGILLTQFLHSILVPSQLT